MRETLCGKMFSLSNPVQDISERNGRFCLLSKREFLLKSVHRVREVQEFEVLLLLPCPESAPQLPSPEKRSAAHQSLPKCESASARSRERHGRRRVCEKAVLPVRRTAAQRLAVLQSSAMPVLMPPFHSSLKCSWQECRCRPSLFSSPERNTEVEEEEGERMQKQVWHVLPRKSFRVVPLES